MFDGLEIHAVNVTGSLQHKKGIIIADIELFPLNKDIICKGCYTEHQML